ncbi:hypothetical protein PsW64_02203 [Pseudovibrio sp. W64]|nr:hypothetical protein PsW64_02203 [Pseudovibrio sp. W64]
MATSSEFVGTVKVMNVGAGYQRAVGGMMNSSIAMGKYEDVGMNKTTVVGKRYEIVCGGCKIVMNSDGTMLIEAEKELVLKGGKIKLN